MGYLDINAYDFLKIFEGLYIFFYLLYAYLGLLYLQLLFLRNLGMLLMAKKNHMMRYLA